MKITTDSDVRRDQLDDARRIAEVGQVLKNYSDFVQAKDIEGLLELFSDDVVVFDLMTPFQYVGIEALRARLEDWLRGYDGGLTYNFDQLQIHTCGDLAVAHALVMCSGVIMNDSKKTGMWLRVTMTLKDFEGDWRIIHEHTSEPFEMETGRAVQQRDSH